MLFTRFAAPGKLFSFHRTCFPGVFLATLQAAQSVHPASKLTHLVCALVLSSFPSPLLLLFLLLLRRFSFLFSRLALSLSLSLFFFTLPRSFLDRDRVASAQRGSKRRYYTLSDEKPRVKSGLKLRRASWVSRDNR